MAFDLKAYERQRCETRKQARRSRSLIYFCRCAECQRQFLAKHKLARICSDSCKLKRATRMRKLYRKLFGRKPVRLTEAKRAVVNTRARAAFAEKMAKKNANLFIICKGCGERRQVPNGRFEYCSRDCQKETTRRNNRERARMPDRKVRRNAFLRAKLKRDPLYRLRTIVSKTVWRALRKRHAHKWGSVLNSLPFKIVDLKAHLEAQFTAANGFSWENYGTAWDIDHIQPQAAFPYATMDCQLFRDCWALRNLRPLDKKANQQKHARLCQPI